MRAVGEPPFIFDKTWLRGALT